VQPPPKKKKRKSIMQTVKKLILFFTCNFLGFFLPSILYFTGLKTHFINLQAENFNIESFYVGTTQLHGTDPTPVPAMIFFPSMTWAVCALFSFAYFFVGEKWKRLFLLAPLVVPFLHSLVTMIISM